MSSPSFMSISVRSVLPLRSGIAGLKPNCGAFPEETPSIELKTRLLSVRRQQKIFMSSASELFAQSSSFHRQHLPQPCLLRHLLRALATPVQPVFKVLNLDDMRDLGISDLYRDLRQSASDLADPVPPAHRGEGLGDCFVEGLRCHVE